MTDQSDHIEWSEQPRRRKGWFVTDPRQVSATQFKARCLALLDQVALDRVPLVVTKHGRPVARVVPLEEPAGRSTMGSVEILTDDDDELFSTGATWDASE